MMRFGIRVLISWVKEFWQSISAFLLEDEIIFDDWNLPRNESRDYSEEREFLMEWCDKNGYTDLQRKAKCWWAIPPNGVMPIPLTVGIRRGAYFATTDCLNRKRKRR